MKNEYIQVIDELTDRTIKYFSENLDNLVKSDNSANIEFLMEDNELDIIDDLLEACAQRFGKSMDEVADDYEVLLESKVAALED